MSIVYVKCTDGSSHSVFCEQIDCPNCRTLITPTYMCYDNHSGVIFCSCPVHKCGTVFLLKECNSGMELLPNHPLSRESFSEIIKSVSTSFNEIYNEAFAAEQMGLMEICGVGYRKALEFLIKDYVMDGKDADVQEKIKQDNLGSCIEKYVTDSNVKNVSKRAVWIGNDETHYVRKWENKDVHDLKSLIRLTIRWIEQEKETADLLVDMPARK